MIPKYILTSLNPESIAQTVGEARRTRGLVDKESSVTPLLRHRVPHEPGADVCAVGCLRICGREVTSGWLLISLGHRKDATRIAVAWTESRS